MDEEVRPGSEADGFIMEIVFAIEAFAIAASFYFILDLASCYGRIAKALKMQVPIFEDMAEMGDASDARIAELEKRVKALEKEK